MDRPSGSSLETAMRENAVFSAATGVALTAGAAWLDTWLGAPAWFLLALGVGLVAYAVGLVWFTRTPERLLVGGRLAVLADIAWVVGAVVLLVGFRDALTTQGSLVVALVSLVVLVFAVAQWRGLRAVRSALASA